MNCGRGKKLQMICVIEEKGNHLAEIIQKAGYQTSARVDCDKNELTILNNIVPDLKSLSPSIGTKPIILIGKAVRIIETIGVEDAGTIEERRVFMDSSPWDKRGFQCYKNHPLFEGLFGGFYSIHLNGLEKIPNVFYYLGSRAKVVAVEKRYISYIRERKLIWLHDIGGFPVLSIGGYLSFEEPDNPYNAEARRFIENSILWMLSPNRQGKYWIESDSVFVQTSETSDQRLPSVLSVTNWPVPSMEIENARGYINSTGRRILANLSVHRIEEVWVHPFRIFRSMEFSIDGEHLSEALNRVLYTPERVVYKLCCGEITVFCSLENPYLFLQFDFYDYIEHSIDIRIESDLRIMWPMDDAFNGEKRFTKLDNGFILKTEDGQIKSLFIFSSPSSLSLDRIDKEISVTIGSKVTGTAVLSVISCIEDEELPKQIDMQDEILKANEFYLKYLEKGRIITDDSRLNEALDMARIGAIKFRVTVPNLGTGLVAGYASSRPGWFSARPGYAWYFGRDSLWCSLAFLDSGDFTTVKENLELLMKFQRIDGKIYHELTTSNVVHYDAADSTPLYLYAMYRYCLQSGDIEFARKNWGRIEKALDYCSETDSDGDGLIENTIAGHGWVEGGKLYGAKASFYLNCIWIAALRGIEMLSSYLGEERVKSHLSNLQERCLIGLEKLYDPETGFVLGIDEAGKQMKFRTIMSSMGLIFNCVPHERISAQIEDLASDDFSTDWGVRIIGKSSGIFNPKGYHEGSVWPLFTGWAALAQFRLGADLDAHNHMLANLYTNKDFSSGYIPEVLHGNTYELSGICPHQAWSETMGFQPFYEGVLGFAPNMIEGIIDFQPSIPLNLRRVEAPCLALGSNCLALSYECTTLISDWIEVTQHFRIHMEKEFSVRFTPWIPKQSSNVGISVNNEPLPVRTLDGITSKRVELDTSISGKMLDIFITYTAPFLIFPVEPQLTKGKKSSQPRIISIRRISESDCWQLIVRSPGKITSIPIMASGKIEAENADIVGNELIVKGNKSNSYKTVTVLLKAYSRNA
ncbi:amylo-alpha-1,6-glucosidase [Mesotoga sp. UBA5557]|jgi:hypothetical protein|uniref:amylo-alpha-1,6-glucosidase n=1 Tax=Mesotoga sp. UBA5557 TaxID=1946857 RepID=UPI0025DF4FA9|nr:GH116 family glycosyl hydrolase [Mesotoga sp. UBA5557]